MKKYKVIIDTDPGVDDTNALLYVLNDAQFDIKLITTAKGNIPLKNATRNMLHILDLLHKNIPVVEGYEERLGHSTEDATFLHTIEGLGGYNPPKNTKHKAIDMDCADAMYDVLKQYPKQITLVVLGPHTNVAHLLMKYPDSKDLIKNIVMMGGAPMGIKSNPNHNSFNIRTDAPAFKMTVDSKIPIVMVPSSIGRDGGYFTEADVEKIKNTNDIGWFLAKTFETYWEPNYDDKRIAVNDIAAVYYITHPRLYKTKRADIIVDEKTGKTTAVFKFNGNFKIVMSIHRRSFHKLIFKKLDEMSVYKLPEIYAPARSKAVKPKKKTTKKTTKKRAVKKAK